MANVEINTVSITRARRSEKIKLNAGDVVEVVKNGNEIFKLTIPANKTFNGVIGIDGLIT